MIDPEQVRLHGRTAPSPVRGAIAGVMGGLIASAVMNMFQSGWQRIVVRDSSAGGEPSTVKAAQKVARSVSGTGLPPGSKGAAGNAVHYAFGTMLGGAYGLAAEYLPGLTAGGGTVFGMGSMLLFDDAAVPAAGLSGPIKDTSLSTHAYSALSHLIYGSTVEGVRRLILPALEPGDRATE